MPEAMELAFEERGSGPVLVFIHGFPFDRTMWIPQLAGLAKIRTCVAVDLRGHGLSEDRDPGDYSFDLFADDVAATLDTLKVQEADVCGLSMGGYVAFSMWRRHRDRVRSLILIDTKAEADSDEARAGREATADLVAKEGMGVLHEKLGPKLVGGNPSQDVIDRVQAMFTATSPEIAAADSLAMRDRTDSTPDLPTIDVPVLWLHGEEDQLMPLAGAEASAKEIPGARFVSIPKAGHVASMENPDAVNDAIADFLPAKLPKA
ncbi:MAG TPA: alpha/beta fold hydrolase [Actinomycetota bacterium]